MCAVQSRFRLLRSPQSSHQDTLGLEGLQVFNVRHDVHHQRQPAPPHDHPQRPPTLHVPLLPEDVQVITQLQEAHEDAQVRVLTQQLMAAAPCRDFDVVFEVHQ